MGGGMWYKLLHKRPPASAVGKALLRRFNYAFDPSGAALPPLRLFINLNNRCNAKCRQCDVGLANVASLFHQTMIQDGGHELAVERLEKLFEEVGRHKPLIAFNGVEPTLYRDLPRAVAAAKRSGCQTQVTTNGILLPRLAADLFDAGLDSIWVSLDGPAALHDQIRGIPGGFEKALEGLRLLHGLKKRRGAGPALNAVMTVFHMNQDAVYELMNVLEGSGIAFNEVMIQHLQYITAAQAAAHNAAWPAYPVTAISTSASDPALVYLPTLLEEIRRVESRRFGLNLRWKPYLRSMEELKSYYQRPDEFIETKCRVFWSELQILANGAVTGSQRCFALPQLGNINETPFMEIWNGPAAKEWRRLLRGQGALPACSRCCSIL